MSNQDQDQNQNKNKKRNSRLLWLGILFIVIIFIIMVCIAWQNRQWRDFTYGGQGKIAKQRYFWEPYEIIGEYPSAILVTK